MESLADNMLYARDHNIDYVSTFQKKKAKKKKEKRKKKMRKRKKKKKIKREKRWREGRQPLAVPSCAQIMG
jgi:hypothetical protein